MIRRHRSVRVFTLPSPTLSTASTATPGLTRLFLLPILLPKTCFQRIQLPVATIVFKRAVVVQNYEISDDMTILCFSNALHCNLETAQDDQIQCSFRNNIIII